MILPNSIFDMSPWMPGNFGNTYQFATENFVFSNTNDNAVILAVTEKGRALAIATELPIAEYWR